MNMREGVIWAVAEAQAVLPVAEQMIRRLVILDGLNKKEQRKAYKIATLIKELNDTIITY